MAHFSFIIVVITLTQLANNCLALKNTTKSKHPASLIETIKQTNLNKANKLDNVTGTTFPSDRPTLVYILQYKFVIHVT